MKESVYTEIKRLAGRSGKITAERVLEVARNPSNPLHGEFQWNDAIAAHGYRLEQARELIRTVKIQTTTDTREISTVHYVRDPSVDSGQQGYVSILNLRNNKTMAQKAVAYEFMRAIGALQRAEDIAEVLDVQDIARDAHKYVQKAKRAVDELVPVS